MSNNDKSAQPVHDDELTTVQKATPGAPGYAIPSETEAHTNKNPLRENVVCNRFEYTSGASVSFRYHNKYGERTAEITRVIPPTGYEYRGKEGVVDPDTNYYKMLRYVFENSDGKEVKIDILSGAHAPIFCVDPVFAKKPIPSFAPEPEEHVEAHDFDYCEDLEEEIRNLKFGLEKAEKEKKRLALRLKDTRTRLVRKLDALGWYLEVLGCDAAAAVSEEFPKGWICPDPHMTLLYMHLDSIAEILPSIEA